MNETNLVTHQSSNGTLRIWHGGKMTVEHRELSVERTLSLEKLERARRKNNRRIAGYPAVECSREEKLYNTIFKPQDPEHF